MEYWREICIVKKRLIRGNSTLQIFYSRISFERIQMDILSPPPISFSGKKYLLVKTIAEVMVKQLISRSSVLLDMDQRRNFESKMF